MALQNPVRTDVPAVRAFRTQVARTQRLSPHFLRVTVTAPDLVHFGPADPGAGHLPGATNDSSSAWDQRVKLFLPRRDGSYPQVGLFADPPASIPQWYAAWRQLPESQRNPIRTYTVRSIRHDAQEVDIDVVVHQDHAGPAVRWAMAADVGEELILIGPDRRSQHPGAGIDFTPGTAEELLLVGDETAVPAICSILEALPQRYTGQAYLEVPSVADVLEVSSASQVTVQWLPRGAGQRHGDRMTLAVEEWIARRSRLPRVAATEPQEEGERLLPALAQDAVLWETAEPQGFSEYAWLAGEAGVITALRRQLVREHGMSRRQVSFMGYWKHGRPSA